MPVDTIIQELTNYVVWILVVMGSCLLLVYLLVLFLGIVFFLWKKIGEK